MVAACTPEQRQELHSVICTNLREALRPWEKNLPNYTDADLAQLFDEYFKLGYDGPMPGTKAALFHVVQDAKDELEWARRLTGLVRTIARRPNQIAASIARREGRTGPIAPEVSSHELAEVETYLDPNAVPDTHAAQVDLQKLAKNWAGGFFLTLSRTHKAALWSIAEDRPITDPELLQLAARGKSSIANARNDLADLLRHKLRQFCAAEAPEVIDALALEVAKAMLPLATEWGQLENLKRGPS